MADEKKQQNEAYKVTQDVSLPRALFEIGQYADGTPIYETQGVAYDAGDYLMASDLTPRDRERAENGDLAGFLVPVDAEEANTALTAGQFSTHVAEHSVEHEAMLRYGHNVIPHDVAMRMNAEGAETAREAQEQAKLGGRDARATTFEFTEGPSDSEDLRSEPANNRVVGHDYSAAEEVESAQTLPSGVYGGQVKEDAEAPTLEDNAMADRLRRQADVTASKAKRPTPKKSSE